jgi:hypothetical protein
VTTSIGSLTTAPTATPMLGSSDDPMDAMYAMLSEARQSDVSAGENQVDENEMKRQQDETQARAALQQEQANQANSGGGFFSDVGHFISDVARDIAHGHFGSAIDDGGRDLEAAWNSPKFWSDLKTGLEDVAMVAGAVTAAVATAGVGGIAIGAAVETAGALAGGTAAVAGGAAGLASARVAHFAAAAEDASADATAAQDGAQQIQQLTADVLAGIKETDQSHERALASLTQAIQTHDQCLDAASSMTVRG